MSKNRWLTAEDAYERKVRNRNLLIAAYLVFTLTIVVSITMLLG